MGTLDLFATNSEVLAGTHENEASSLSRVNGLSYIRTFVSEEVECKILGAIDQQPWIGDLERRVQHYGYRYNYKSRRIDESMRVGELPQWLVNIGRGMVERGYFEELPDQVIVNEYLPGQGITAHIDCEPCFGETIASLSLGSTCFMDFTRPETGEKVSVWLEPRSLVILQGEARHLWRHAISKRLNDSMEGRAIPRTRRVSLTFRKIKAEWLAK